MSLLMPESELQRALGINGGFTTGTQSADGFQESVLTATKEVSTALQPMGLSAC